MSQKFFTEKNKGGVWVYAADGSEDEFIQPGLTKITEAQAKVILAAEAAQLSAPAQQAMSCTRRQGLLALLDRGIKRADIEARIAEIEDEVEREGAWIEYEAATWDSGNLRVRQLWAAMGGTPEQLDDVFRLAVTL